MIRRAMGLMICMALLAGCRTTKPRCQVSVGNATDDKITDVRIEFDGDVKYQADAVPPHDASSYKGVPAVVPASLIVKWKAPDGSPQAREVKAANPLPPSFKGRVLFQVEMSGNIKTFVMPDNRENTSEIPWGNSANWDGSVMLPGMNR